MGPKFASLFLYAASGNASSGRWPPRRAAWPAIPEPGKTRNAGAAVARRDWDDSIRGTPARSPRRCDPTSTVRWDSRWRRPLSATLPTVADIGPRGVWVGAPGRAWLSAPWPHLVPTPVSNDRPRLSSSRRDGKLPPSSVQPSAVRPLAAADAPTSLPIHVVSCNIYRHSRYITLAKRNNSGITLVSAHFNRGHSCSASSSIASRSSNNPSCS